MKNIYKCEECSTTITVETNVHEMPESIICPCEATMPSIGA
jgi:predicted nucleic acid-binding Zn ribbon protein